MVFLQDTEVNYFQTYIDGVDFVFIESPVFRHIGNNIYGGSRVVSMFIIFLKYNLCFRGGKCSFLDYLTISMHCFLRTK